jgi:Holliday junction resolvase
MSLKDKLKIGNEEIDVVIIEAPVKNKAELEKIQGNLEGISEFAEKLGGRYEIRMKLDKTLWNYLTEIDLVLPILDKIKFSELNLNLMIILGYFFCISIFIL